jgi:hypothetical protein
MSSTKDSKVNFSVLEQNIQKLMGFCDELKKENQVLRAENRSLKLSVDEDKERSRRLEEGYKNLKEMEKSSSRQSINNMKRKINDIIAEIDRNMSLIDDKS